MSEKNFLTYKGKPLVRKGNVIYYGNMGDDYVVRFEILSVSKEGKAEIADKVSVRLLKNIADLPEKDRISKETEKPTLFDALDIGFIWLDRALKG